ncbi:MULTISPECIES: hypothetical protein [Sandaracinus]|uniref:hypothetical protein n=1 Tax=Sandaracinus TaxID=1055688 RepID=UPI0019D4BC4F|nr:MULTISPECIES: hypothetical protein [Sandaracinus]
MDALIDNDAGVSDGHASVVDGDRCRPGVRRPRRDDAVHTEAITTLRDAPPIEPGVSTERLRRSIAS